MKTLALLSAVLGAAGAGSTAAGIPSWAYGIGAIVGAAGWLRFYFLPRAERRISEATASKTGAEAERESVGAAHDAVEFVREEYQRVTAELQNERVRADDMHAKFVTAQSSLAAAQAAQAEALSRATTDRSTMQRQIQALEEALHHEQAAKRALRDQLETIQAQLGQKERRHQTTRRRADVPKLEP